jgi:hypothetical protein
MARAHLILSALLSATGCAVVQTPFLETLPAGGLAHIEATIDSGSVELRAGGPDITIDGLSWGMAAQREAAANERDQNHWDVSTQADALMLSAQSQGGGVDFMVTAPSDLSSDLYLSGGDATLIGMRGSHWVSADEIYVSGVSGYLDLAASRDISGDFSPRWGDVYILTSDWGDVDIRLPWGAEVDLVVWSDPTEPLVVDDLGFHFVAGGPGYFAGVSGRGTTRIDIFAPDGEVRVSSGW